MKKDMKMESETLKALAPALSAAWGEMTTAKRTRANTYFKSSYAELSDIMDACRAPLVKNGFAITQNIVWDDEGKPFIVTTLLHASGEFLRGVFPILAKETNPQAWGSAQTYARRYSLTALVGVATEEDDDANVAAGNGNGTASSVSGKSEPAPVAVPVNGKGGPVPAQGAPAPSGLAAHHAARAGAGTQPQLPGVNPAGAVSATGADLPASDSQIECIELMVKEQFPDTAWAFYLKAAGIVDAAGEPRRMTRGEYQKLYDEFMKPAAPRS